MCANSITRRLTACPLWAGRRTPKINLIVRDSLEGLTESSKAAILVTAVYTRKGYRLKLEMEKGPLITGPLLNSPSMMCDNTHGILPTGEAHPRLGVQSLDWPMAGRFPGGSDDQESACSEGDLGSIPGSGRFPGEGNGNPLQHSCLENPMGGGAW